MSPLPTPSDPAPPSLGKAHARRLREIYRSAGWPCQDPLEIELLAAGLLERVQSPSGHESLRVTDAGVRALAAALAGNRAAFTAHESLVERVAQEMGRAGRIVWRGIGLRAQVPQAEADPPFRWCMARPDVFSIRNTSLAAAVDPIVHEVKVRRADLLGDLRHEAKRAAYLDLGECWYVLGCDARGRCIAAPEEVPPECGVLVLEHGRLHAARAAPRSRRSGLPFGVWMALAKATPVAGLDDDAQALLALHALAASAWSDRPGGGAFTRPFSGSVGSCKGSGLAGLGASVGAGVGADVPGMALTPVRRRARADPRRRARQLQPRRRRPRECRPRWTVRVLPFPARVRAGQGRV